MALDEMDEATEHHLIQRLLSEFREWWLESEDAEADFQIKVLGGEVDSCNPRYICADAFSGAAKTDAADMCCRLREVT